MRRYISMFFVLISLLMILSAFHTPEWGFYGHRKINRMAVFTLPSDMIKFFKVNIEFLTDHAVDPDKRRYATKHEAVRHYIDIDHWGADPFDNVPKNLTDAVLKYGHYQYINDGDTLTLYLAGIGDSITLVDVNRDVYIEDITYDSLRARLFLPINQNYYDGEFDFEPTVFADAQMKPLRKGGAWKLVDRFSEFGILPYHLNSYYKNLVDALEKKSINRILRICAEMGHYLGDAHVPLHTTENYNGQMTNQVGIHGFWESRIPELFADEEYDFFVGKATYIEDKKEYFWQIVEDSHALLDSVLSIEKRLSIEFPQDKQFCYDERLEQSVRIQCPEYADAYQLAMNGMVEQRMQDAILSIGSVWYSAWVDAGQPDLLIDDEIILTKEEQEELDKINKSFQQGSIIGREH